MKNYEDVEQKLHDFLRGNGDKEYIVTLEGGASKTIIEVFTRAGESVSLKGAEGDIFSSITIGPSNLNQVGGGALELGMREAFEGTVVESSGATLLSILPKALVVAGVAGLGTERNQAAMKGILARLGFREKSDFLMVDAVASLGYVAKPGAMVIAGTGSIVMGSIDGKKVMREGGDGPIFGEPGSGYDLSIQALHYAVHVERGKYFPIDETDTFYQTVKEFCQKTFELSVDAAVETLLTPLNKHEFEVRTIAGLAPIVFEHAFKQKHEHAQEIISQAAEKLGAQLFSILRRMPVDQSINILLVGGLFKSPYANQFIDQIDAALKRFIPGVKVGYQNSKDENVVSGLLQKALQAPLAAVVVPGAQFRQPPRLDGEPQTRRAEFAQDSAGLNLRSLAPQ